MVSTTNPFLSDVGSHTGFGGGTPNGVLVGCTPHTSTTATSGVWVNWKSRNCGLLPPVSYVLTVW